MPAPALAERLAAIHGAGKQLQAAWTAATQASGPSETPRTFDRRLDRAWSIIHDRAQHWVEIEHPQQAERAASILARVFPTGLDFLGLAFADEWAESEKRLTTIADAGLDAALGELVGGTFVEHLKAAHADYGEILGITAKKEESAPARVLESINDLRAAMSDYAMLTIGLTRRSDPDAVAASEAALEPILRFRTPRGQAEDTSEAPSEPLPEPPSGSDGAGE